MVFRGNMGKNVLFLACRSVRNSFLKFLVHVLGPQTWPSRQNTRFLGSRLIFLPGPRTGKEASPIIFLGNLGCTLAPQTTRSALVSVWGSVEFFARSTHFSVSRYSETSTRYSKTSTKKTLVFLASHVLCELHDPC